ncbi:hypothetical protein C2E23DRAFT_814873 [Lenzites betulinus]|nr:hypothetical protein C2E23DRAFT_814873 [Lenzites betulinus]
MEGLPSELEGTLLDVDGQTFREPLLDLPARFFIPRLADKPQNPIMDTLRLLRNSERPQPTEPPLFGLPPELEVMSQDVAQFVADKQTARLEDIWRIAVSEKPRHKNQVLSWDALRSSRKTSVALSPFLSEQSSDTFASARYYVRPPLQDPTTQLVYTHIPELFDSLILTISGTSSYLHIWDTETERFVLRNLRGREQGHIVIVGKDEVVSARLALIRTTPVSHAFTHSLSSILAYLRQLAEAIPVDFQATTGDDARLTALWTRYEDMEDILKALAALCGRDEDTLPSEYVPVPSTPTTLLSSIYTNLSDHLERSSSRIVTAVLAFLLTATSRSYFQSLCASVGYNTPGSHVYPLPTRGPTRTEDRMLDDDNFTNLPGELEDLSGDGFPEFIGPEAAEIISRARQSLVLLSAADPNHPLLTSTHMHQAIDWMWTEEQIDNLADKFTFGIVPPTQEAHHDPPPPSSTDVLDAFKIFDLPPGETSSTPTDITTPTAAHLSGAHTTAPLITFLNARLQDALFSDAEEMSAPVIGSRMYAARETGDRKRTRTQSGAAGGGSKSRGRKEGAQEPGRRAIGLSPALTVGDQWPPGGTDLNFHLRTVIVDSLEEGRGDSERDEDWDWARAQRKILEEAEWRLGFAIRDLPAGTGREKWLNPLCEALDFLYMHYQPPHPLDVVITPATLSKYHRIFAFNLRLMRVENVVRTLFRMTRHAADPLFPTLAPANKRLLHFRAVAHTFVMGLAAYVYDVAIGSNVDGFLARLPAAPPISSPPSSEFGDALRQSALGHSSGGMECATGSAGFADVFGLAEHHARVLDDVLSSCLLRSGQKAVGDLLRQCMELVLELGVLAGERKDGRMEEYEAAPALEDLWARFRTKMTMFVKVLKALVEKEADSSGLVLSEIPLHMMQGHRRISGTTANLHQLLLRLNMSDWWTKGEAARQT